VVMLSAFPILAGAVLLLLVVLGLFTGSPFQI
jgi:hypothetical protein